MRRILSILLSLLWTSVLPAFSQVWKMGIPFFQNYSADDYEANNRNADILVDPEGRVFVANFEGLLYYDMASWRTEHLTNLTRPTALFCDGEGTLWVGGYNYFGHVEVKSNGQLQLVEEERHLSFLAEVVRIWEEKEGITFRLTNDSVYGLRDGQLRMLGQKAGQSVVATSWPEDIDVSITQVLAIDNRLKAVATMGRGLFLYDDAGNMLCNISEQNGLCSNNINRLAYNGKGMLWGATENGIFSMSVPSAWTQFSKTEGVHGEVYCIRRYHGQMYVGTTSGLYRRVGFAFEHVGMVNHLCWGLEESEGRLLVASEGGLYQVDAQGNVEQLHNHATRAVVERETLFYTGEADGVYLNAKDGTRYAICQLPNVVRIAFDGYEGMWLETLYGEIWYRSANQTFFSQYTKDIQMAEHTIMKATLVNVNGRMVVVDALDEKPFEFAQFSYAGKDSVVWLTNSVGTGLYAWKNGKKVEQYASLLYPLRDVVVRCMWEDGHRLWFGGESGLMVIDRSVDDPVTGTIPGMRICSVSVNGDSIVWGGMGEQWSSLPILENSENNLRFTFTLDNYAMQAMPQYQYRMDDGEWSSLTEETYALFNNQRAGKHLFQVRAVDSMGRMSDVATMQFTIRESLFLRWYMILLYLVLLGWLIAEILRWRTRRLEADKRQLEAIVSERTAELRQTQSELIRQEKMATVGKLTQGLIDRILNPLNYINNFSKLSMGLIKDIEANIDDEKEVMDAENYEDTKEVIGMLEGNLGKVSEHGQNTTRTLKAMEEMLKDRTGGITDTDLCTILHQDEEMLSTYYAKEVKENNIKVTFVCPAQPVMVSGNPEQLSKVFMSILANAVYAVVKKAQRVDYEPKIDVTLSTAGEQAVLTFLDNGIGIEETVIEKIFDPFFTTKTTSEAAGVGLYLSREIVQNYQGDISVKSVKNDYSEFTIVLPKKNQVYGTGV